VLREPGIGGTCPRCGELHASEARFCSRCGLDLTARGAAETAPPAEDPPAAVQAANGRSTASDETAVRTERDPA